jgi:hypothetical protein
MLAPTLHLAVTEHGVCALEGAVVHGHSHEHDASADHGALLDRANDAVGDHDPCDVLATHKVAERLEPPAIGPLVAVASRHVVLRRSTGHAGGPPLLHLAPKLPPPSST